MAQDNVPKIPRMFVVGVDFGTTFSGFTYALEGQPEVYETFNYPGAGGRLPYPKVPTSLLYDTSKPPKAINWGWEAEANKHTNPMGYVKLFKLSLAPPRMKVVQQYVPEGVTAEQCISDYLRFMKEFVVDTLVPRSGGLTRDKITQNIQWCITVPAIWEDAAKDAMEKAARRAGMLASAEYPGASPHPLIIVLEPEAASLYSASQKEFSDFLKPGEPYLILDMGGGTTDIAVHSFQVTAEKNSGKILKEVVAGAGGLCGGSHIDQYFMAAAEAKIPKLIEVFQRNEAEAFFKFLTKWDQAKKTFRGQEENISIELPGKLQTYWKTVSGSQVGSGEDDLSLVLTNAEMKRIFDPVIDHIAQLTLVQRKKVQDIAHVAPRLITFVGGLSESPYIKAKLAEKFQGAFEKIFTPTNPGCAVAKGASVYGANPNLVSERIARRTYAVEVPRPMKPGDPQAVQFKHQDGTVWSDGLVTWVSEGDKVPKEHTVVEYLSALNPKDTNIIYRVYSSPNRDIRFRTDPDVRRELDLVLDLPKDAKQERVIETKIYFGETTIRIEAKNTTTNLTIRHELKFMAEKK